LHVFRSDIFDGVPDHPIISKGSRRLPDRSP
jgi:hypothetical protein